MSYKIYKFEAPRNYYFRHSLPIEAEPRERVVLIGEGEHQGTSLVLTPYDLQSMPANAAEFAAELDRRFLRKHHDRNVGEITGIWVDEWTNR